MYTLIRCRLELELAGSGLRRTDSPLECACEVAYGTTIALPLP